MSKVKLISLSKPSADTGCHTAEELVAYAARVSNPSNQNNAKTAGKLVRYLIRENHWSPLEMVHLTLEITTTRDISRQIISQRYAKSESFEVREARLQDLKNRQNSVALTEDNVELSQQWRDKQSELLQQSKEIYNWALDNGIAKEQARAVLPEGNTETTLYMAGTLRSWIHYCDLRMGNGTQKEHMDVAKQCWELIGVHFPDVIKALEE